MMMKKLFTLLLLMHLPLMASAEVEQTIHVAKAGTLSSYISDEEKYQIEKLTLTGEINGEDLGFLREMARGLRERLMGWASQESDRGALSVLDLSGVKIVEGGEYLSIFSEGLDEYTKFVLESNDVIPSSAFWGCKSLTSVIIPNSVTSIGNSAFSGTNLTSVSIPNSVTSIGNSAFVGTNLTSVLIPNSVTSIGGGAFYETPWFENQPDGIVYAGKVLYAYKGTMAEGTSISIQEGTLSIADEAFKNCSGLISIDIPNSVLSIGYNAFNGCTSLTSITIPNSVTSIGTDAFYNTPWYDNQSDGVVYTGKVLYKYKGTMPEGTSISIEEGTLGIGSSAFYGCSGLTSVTIPNSITSIGSSAFYSCNGLTSVTIPQSVTSIGGSAFSGCSGLTSVTIPQSVTSIGGRAFSGCSGLTSVTIPNSVTSIGGGAFSGCNGLTSVTIPNSVTFIGEYTFSGCTGLTSIDIPNSVTSICYYAFSRCSNLTSVTIPNSVFYIGPNVFERCSSLISITIPNSVTSIDYRAFLGCSSLTSVTIPNSVTSIGDGAFNGCSGLLDFYSYAIDVPSAIGAFPDLSNAILHVPSGSIDAYRARNPWNKFKEIVTIEEKDETSEDVIKITSAGQTTWSSAYDLDFTDVEGLKAYIASGYDRETGTIWLTRVKKVPAKEGILLIGDAGDYKVPHLATTAYYANLMVGTVEAITINETDGEYTNYYLSNGASGIGFYKVNGSVEIKANRAYLPLLKNTVSGTRGFIGMEFGEDADGTTDVQSSMFNLQYPDVYYNLQGQRVDHPSKGLYIKNGKKVLIK